jgi:hypothetical protein
MKLAQFRRSAFLNAQLDVRQLVCHYCDSFDGNRLDFEYLNGELMIMKRDEITILNNELSMCEDSRNVLSTS